MKYIILACALILSVLAYAQSLTLDTANVSSIRATFSASGGTIPGNANIAIWDSVTIDGIRARREVMVLYDEFSEWASDHQSIRQDYSIQLPAWKVEQGGLICAVLYVEPAGSSNHCGCWTDTANWVSESFMWEYDRPCTPSDNESIDLVGGDAVLTFGAFNAGQSTRYGVKYYPYGLGGWNGIFKHKASPATLPLNKYSEAWVTTQEGCIDSFQWVSQVDTWYVDLQDPCIFPTYTITDNSLTLQYDTAYTWISAAAGGPSMFATKCKWLTHPYEWYSTNPGGIYDTLHLPTWTWDTNIEGVQFYDGKISIDAACPNGHVWRDICDEWEMSPEPRFAPDGFYDWGGNPVKKEDAFFELRGGVKYWP